jgi:predicted aspartyl protease
MDFPYLASYFPPMPALEIQLAYPGEGFAGKLVAAIVDTGADGTLIPLGILDAIGAPIVDETPAIPGG